MLGLALTLSVLVVQMFGRATPAAAAEGNLSIYAAADLAIAFKEIVPRFETENGIRVTLVLGSTGNLAKQIENGAPADVFFAANQSFLDGLIGQGVVLRDSRTLYAQGRIVLATARRFGIELKSLKDLLDSRVKHVAIANPSHAPYGKAAEEALRRTGVWEDVKPKLVYGENVRQALQFIESGAAEAGIIALSIATVPEITYTLIPADLHAPLNQAAGVVARSNQPDLARSFIAFINSTEGRRVMKRFGFLLPGEF